MGGMERHRKYYEPGEEPDGPLPSPGPVEEPIGQVDFVVYNDRAELTGFGDRRTTGRPDPDDVMRTFLPRVIAWCTSELERLDQQ